MENKFKVGDRIRYIKVVTNSRTGYVDRMEDYIGREDVVASEGVLNSGGDSVIYTFKNSPWYWDEECIELVVPRLSFTIKAEE